MNIDWNDFLERAKKHFPKNKQGMNKTEIARKVLDELGNPEGLTIESARRNLSKKIQKNILAEENPALYEEAKTVGIAPEDIRMAWYKGKNWSISFSPSDKGPKFEDMLKDHIDSVKKHTFKYEIKRNKEKSEDRHLLVVDPADIHVGKLARAYETGEEYNTEIAIKRVHEGVAGILEKVKGFHVEKILFVAGNDVLHIDTPDRKTRKGTSQDTDGMWYDNFLKAKEMYITVIDRLLLEADVHFVFNPSNHDYTNGFFLAHNIESWYKDCKNITFDNSIAHRKYYQWNNNLIGTTHGDGAKNNDLPLLMATEAKNMWADTKHRYIYTHHVHHKTSKDYAGVTLESLRSPSSSDSWHHIKGYQHSPRAIEGFLHHSEFGQIARLTHTF
jgi:hypothetical protein|tara:strand:+ start:621 stop:1781 length:1161 start_codon:yes stop_codon:yes gene_type:complete